MTKTAILLAAAATFSLSATAFAGDDAYPNGHKDMPGSSTAATPKQVKQSPGTVGAMQDASKGGFTASKKEEGGEHLNGNTGK